MLEFFAQLINTFLHLIKWPVATIVALLTPKIFILFFKIIMYIFSNNEFYQPLFYGIFLYSILWFLFFNKDNLGWFMVFEHELTHTIFAFITFHKIVGLCATNNSGGIMSFMGGKGNWLIDVAPYFFPTLGFIVALMLGFASPDYYSFLIFILGFFIMYHIHSTIKEFSFKQPDIQEAGVVFSVMFLPGANLLALICLLSAIPYDRINCDLIMKYLYLSLEKILEILLIFIKYLFN